MTTHEKIAAVRELAGLNQNRFAALIGVAPSTMTRLERGTPSKPSHETLQKISDVFNEITVDWLEDEANEQLPAKLTLTGERSLETLKAPDHEGHSFRRFVERHKPMLNQAVIAAQVGVSRNQVGAYYSTERFRNSVRKNLLTALSKLLDRPVTDEEVFGKNRSLGEGSTPTNLIAVPRLTTADRPKLNARFLSDRQAGFAPAIQPETAMYAPKQAVAVGDHKRAYAIEVGTGDRMEPLYFPGYWVLGLLLEPVEYAKLYDGIVAVVTTDGEFLLKKVLANNLRTTGVLELGSYTVERGGSVQLRKSDIQLMFSIPGIIYGLIA